MADEQVTETTAVAGADESAKTFTQEQLDKVIAERLTRERAKFADHDELRKKAETLEAELKKRKEAEMTELEKAQTAAAEAQRKADELNTYKERWKAYEKRQAERVTKELEGLTDQQKAIVEKLADTDDQLEAISQFKSTQTRPNVAGGAGAKIGGVKFSQDDVKKMSQAEVLANLDAINESRKQW